MSKLSSPEFNNEQAAMRHFESIIWPNGARCPHCGGTERLTRLKGKSRPGLWQCSKCRKQFTAKVGSFFEYSRLPMMKWLQAIYLISSSKKDIPAYQLQRILEVQYNTAWFISHRLREAMKNLHIK
jgi:transposase-like protein